MTETLNEFGEALSFMYALLTKSVDLLLSSDKFIFVTQIAFHMISYIFLILL